MSTSPSGSLKNGATSMAAESPTSTVCADIVPSTTGARLGTVTEKLCVADSPPGSVAMIATVVLPLATATTVTTASATRVSATAVSDVAPYASPWPSGSRK